MNENIRMEVIEQEIEHIRQACGMTGERLCIEGSQRLMMKSLFNIIMASELFTDCLYDPSFGAWRIEAAPRIEYEAGSP